MPNSFRDFCICGMRQRSARYIRMHRLYAGVPADLCGFDFTLSSAKPMRGATLNCQLGVALAIRALAMKSPDERVEAWQLLLKLFKALQALGQTKTRRIFFCIGGFC